MKILAVRHGQTLDNISGTCQGQSQGILSEHGIHQAQMLYGKLRHVHIDACYSSDLQRAVNTAEIITDLKPVLDYRLRERNFGSLQGKRLTDVLAMEIMPPDVETVEQISTRLESFFNDLRTTHTKDETILIVSHGFTIKVMIGYLNNYDTQTILNMKTVENCSVTELEII